MYILYNKDGSVVKKNLTDYIQKGNNNVNSIFVSIVDVDFAWTLAALFELPNGDITVETPTEDEDYEIDGTSYSGWVVPITAAETVYEGIIKLSLEADKNTNQTLFTTSVKLVVNPAVDEPDETTITYAQYSSLLNLVNQKAAKTYVDLLVNTLASESDAKYIRKYETPFNSGDLLANIFLTLGTKPGFFIYNNNWYIGQVKQDAFLIIDFQFENLLSKERYIGRASNTTIIGNILTTSSQYYKPYATEEYVSENATKLYEHKLQIKGVPSLNADPVYLTIYCLSTSADEITRFQDLPANFTLSPSHKSVYSNISFEPLVYYPILMVSYWNGNIRYFKEDGTSASIVTFIGSPTISDTVSEL